MKIQTIFRQYSGNIQIFPANFQTIFRQYSGNIQDFENSGNIQAIFRQYSGNIQTAIVGQLCRIQPSFSGSEKPGFRWSFPMFPMLGVWVSLQIRIMLLFPLAPTPAPLPAKGLILAKHSYRTQAPESRVVAGARTPSDALPRCCSPCVRSRGFLSRAFVACCFGAWRWCAEAGVSKIV